MTPEVQTQMQEEASKRGLEASQPGEDGFYVTKLSERDSKRFIEVLADDAEPSEAVKAHWRKARRTYDRLILGRRKGDDFLWKRR